MAKNYVDIRDDHRFYYQAMRKTIVQFLDLFDGMAIARYDTDTGQLLKYVRVPFKFAPKMKQWYYDEKTDPVTGKRTRNKVLPMMACNLVNVEQALNRTVNTKYKGRTTTQENNNIERFMNPVPYDYSFEVQIASEYMVDITQIMESILPFFNNHIFLRLTIPELDITPADVKDGAHPLDLKVLYEGSSKEETLEFDETDYRIIIWTLNFKVEGYLFKPKHSYPIIKKSIMEYVASTTDPIPAMTTTTVTGVTSEDYPIAGADTTDALYDEDIKTFYRYEKEGGE